MKKYLFFVFPLYFLGLIYLSAPAPSIKPLPQALRSTEPGDTWQNPDQQAYFTDYSREEVLKYFSDTFALNFFGIKIPNYRLNYRPEDTATYVRGYIDSYYLEEIVLPLRDSLFVNGWNPSLSPIYANQTAEERSHLSIVIDGHVFQSKITLKPYYSSIFPRIIIWTLIFPALYFVFLNFKNSLLNLFQSIK